MSDSETTEKPAAPAKKKSKLLVIVVPVVVLLAAGGGGGWYYMKGLHAAPAAEKPVEKEVEPTGVLPIDPFTVNLADPGGRRYLRVAMQLVLPDEEAAKKASEEELLMARVRSALLEVLSTQTSAVLNTPEGRAELKKSISETAEHVGHLDVHDVLFQEFVVQ